jgi:hypothetical protein
MHKEESSEVLPWHAAADLVGEGGNLTAHVQPVWGLLQLQGFILDDVEILHLLEGQR